MFMAWALAESLKGTKKGAQRASSRGAEGLPAPEFLDFNNGRSAYIVSVYLSVTIAVLTVVSWKPIHSLSLLSHRHVQYNSVFISFTNLLEQDI